MIGMMLLIAGTFFALLQAILPWFPKIKSTPWGNQLVATLTANSAFAIGSAFFYLIYVYVTSDLSFVNVALNSHHATLLFYKIAGVWGNHEGSMLLWLFLLTLSATFFALQKKEPSAIRLKTLQILGAISFFYHCFILTMSNPFVQLKQVPVQGIGLNPLLEDPSLAFHPPILYTGLALLSVLFSNTCAALKTNTLTSSWAQDCRPWALGSWIFLTFGIAWGSWWAYYELGWGGWWFWDPVENVSLLPWLTATALIHSLIIAEKQQTQLKTSALLAIASFMLALGGLFLVRSGLLISVHSFAIDTSRGLFLAAIPIIFICYSLLLLLRKGSFGQSEGHNLLSRQSLIFMNVVLLTFMALIVFLGTIFPIFADQVISVDASFYQISLTPVLIVMLISMAAVPFIKWQKTSPAMVLRGLSYCLTAGLASFVLILYLNHGWTIIGGLAFSAAVCVIVATLIDGLRKIKAWNLKYLAMSVAHFGVSILVIGATLDSFEKSEMLQVITLGESIDIKGHRLSLDSVNMIDAPYFQKEQANFILDNKKLLQPEKRYYPLREVITTETAIQATGLADLYLVLGSFQGNDRWTLKVEWHPAIRLVWIGALLLLISGLLAFLQKRTRSTTASGTSSFPQHPF